MAFNLNLTFGPQWENVSNIRNFVSEMLSTGIMDIDDAKKVFSEKQLKDYQSDIITLAISLFENPKTRASSQMHEWSVG